MESIKLPGNSQPPACGIQTWRQFTSEIRQTGCKLLKKLDQYPDAVLVTGCQRSGTTMLSRIITQSAGMVNYWTGLDDELDAALILAGRKTFPVPGRYCFQTTYVDENYPEYFEHTGLYKIIWMLRNPFSVVYSLLYNWRPASLDGTFKKCGAAGLQGFSALLYQALGLPAVSRTRRACALYQTKTQQLLELFDRLGKAKMLVIDYDDLVLHKNSVLPHIFQFIHLPYQSGYAQSIHPDSLHKHNLLTRKERRVIQQVALPLYQRALPLTHNR
ncbi:MAG: sulfotransferase domain-containing protein [Anaerolineae bacterium]|nr:sulfotransferase domain-containing protein [Anaerolineae bacterium]